MEHFNNELKKATNAMGANKTPEAVQRVSKATTALEEAGKQFDKVSFVPKCSSAHSYKSTAGDEQAMIGVIKGLNPYALVPCEHSTFQNISYSVLDKLEKRQVEQWITKAQDRFLKHPLYRNLYKDN